MAKDRISNKFLIITANIGSLFEEYGKDLQVNWMLSFHQLVTQQKPLFIALHFQEIGGKTDYQDVNVVAKFFQELYEPDSFSDYTCTYSYVDQAFDEPTKYTALGCAYFIHKSLATAVDQWNFNLNCFTPVVAGHHSHTIDDTVGTVQKYKFPMTVFSKKAKRLPRKGFTWTRWRIHNKVFDMLNIHLSHDADNVYCTLRSPTKYSKYRKKAFQFVIKKLYELESDHQILFGDFNVRPDTKALVEHLMKGKGDREISHNSNGQPSSIIYKSIDERPPRVLLRVESRIFEMSSYEEFDEDKVTDLVKFCQELTWLKNDNEHQFRELPINFQPTYPHKEDPADTGTTTFGNVRCPSWCDRVLVDCRLFSDVIKNSSDALYDSYGRDLILGDHKPVFLAFNYTIDQ